MKEDIIVTKLQIFVTPGICCTHSSELFDKIELNLYWYFDAA